MRLLSLPYLLLSLGAGIASAQTPGAGSRHRGWTSADGKALSGRMLGTDGQSVSLLVDGSAKPAKVPLARLSEADRAFVAETGWPLPKPWKKWPTDVKVGLADVEVRLASSEGGRYLYQSKHFEFLCEDELAQTPMRDIARMFEATYLLLQASPWGILAKPTGERFRAELYGSRESYIRAGGPPDSAGVYTSERKVFMVPFQSLGLEQTKSGWQRSKEYSTRTLVHELTHMLMADALIGMPIWLTEGAAEYMELMPMTLGTFRPGAHLAAVSEQREKQRNFDMLKAFTMSREQWDRGGMDEPPPGVRAPGSRVLTGMGGFTTRGRQENILALYQSGLLLTYYFIHLDGDGDAARLQRFIAACVKNGERVQGFLKKAEEYNKAFNEFTKHPDVKQIADGRYQFPATMKPPTAPAWPFEGKQEDLHLEDLELLLDGRNPQQLIAQARAALYEVKIGPNP
jgi:hypothetical protein